MLKFKTFLLNILLMVVAGFLLILFSTIGLLTAFAAIIFSGASTNYFRDVALGLDQLGNVMCQHLFNWLLISSKSKFLFGDVDTTISAVLGLNQREGTLSVTGNVLAFLLDTIDKDHCKNSI